MTGSRDMTCTRLTSFISLISDKFFWGCISWVFATERYFGKQTKVVKETRIVELRKPFQDTAILKE